MADSDSVSAKEETKNHVTEDNRTITNETLASEIEPAGEDSEYETLEEDNGLDEDDDEEEEDDDGIIGSRRSSCSRLEDGELTDGDSVIIEDERVEGDGEEESEPLKDRKLDDDEDRRNPQYIPKKGTFYEHDDRTLLDGEEEEGPKDINAGGDDGTVNKNDDEQETKQKKPPGVAGTKTSGKVWVDKGSEKWQHDLYNDDEQRPKSTQELIDTYGYDIRNEEAPPKARRRRRYGRGPNKYTRNWEDEDAYRSAGLPTVSRGRGRGTRGRGRSGRVYKEVSGAPASTSSQEEYPVLGERIRRPRRAVSKPRSSGSGGSGPTAPTLSVPVKKIPKHFNARAKSNDRNHNYVTEQLSVRSSSNNNSNVSVPVSVPVDVYHKDSVIMSRVESTGYPRDGRGRGRTRGGGGAGTGGGSASGGGDTLGAGNKYMMEFTASRGRGRQPPPAFTSQGKPSAVPISSSHLSTINSKLPSVSSVTQNFNHLEISSCTFTSNNAEENIRSSLKDVPSGANERRITEGPPRMQETSSVSVSRSKRYSAQRQRSLPERTYSPPPVATPPQQSQQQPAPQQQHPHQHQQQQHPLPYFPPPAQPIPVPDYPPPPVFNETVPPPQMVAFIPPGPPPPPGTAPPFPPPPIINYVPTPAAFHPIPLQPPPVIETVQQAELFQGQNGITYYSTQTQAALPRQTPPRRVKLAIPIMPPPDQAPRGRGRSTEQDAKA